MDGIAIFFASCAAVGGIPLVIIFLLQLFGGDTGGGDTIDGDFDIADIDSSADISFKFLSFQGLAAFLTMFGLVGLALYQQSQVGIYWATGGGVAAGLFSIWIMAQLYRFFANLQSSGTQDIKNAVGSEGQVYARIPRDGVGRVIISFDNRLREFDAATVDKESLDSGIRIRVVEVSGSTLIVEKI